MGEGRKHVLHIRSMIVASPCPTPTHKVISPYFTFPRRFILYNNMVRMRAPEQPSGCPKAIAPPLTFTISGLRPRSSTTAHREVGFHVGNVLCRFAHGIDTIDILHFGIWIPPAEGRVI